MAGIILTTACTDTTLADTPRPPEAPMDQTDPAAPMADATIVSLTGVRLTRGNAVDCPRLRDDAGREFGVSYLSPAVAIGARVTLRGAWGISTRCRGQVLIVKEETLLTE